MYGRLYATVKSLDEVEADRDIWKAQVMSLAEIRDQYKAERDASRAELEVVKMELVRLQKLNEANGVDDLVKHLHMVQHELRRWKELTKTWGEGHQQSTLRAEKAEARVEKLLLALRSASSWIGATGPEEGVQKAKERVQAVLDGRDDG
jgi:hypothetical protein